MAIGRYTTTKEDRLLPLTAKLLPLLAAMSVVAYSPQTAITPTPSPLGPSLERIEKRPAPNVKRGKRFCGFNRRIKRRVCVTSFNNERVASIVLLGVLHELREHPQLL
jgi:hypothetical protein